VPILPSPDDRLPATLTLDTPRLRLRRFELSDVPRVRELADHPDVAATTLNLAQPYTLADATSFVRGARAAWPKAESVAFAVEARDERTLIGTVGLTVSASNDRAELGYWFGRAYWGYGYATEAARAVVRFGFETLGLNRVFATCFADNPASERVMQKLGMRCEGTMRQHYKRFGLYHDGQLYGLLRSEWLIFSEPS
jgi:RimJ/RimL family protein N-acetyltransferase